ncbi:MAG: hypothetical protein V1712_02770 [Patescibacteria group bacterium]
MISAGWDAIDVQAVMRTDTVPPPTGEHKGLIITAVAVIVLVMAGVVYWYWLRPAPTTPGSANELNNTQNQPATTQTNTINCGTAGFIGFLDNNKVDATAETIKAWECFSDNLKICHPALFKDKFIPSPAEIELQPLEFRIVGKQGDSCLVSGPKGSLGYGVPVTCAFSQILIDWVYSQNDKQFPGQKFLGSWGINGIIFLGGGLVPNLPVPGFGQENVVCN